MTTDAPITLVIQRYYPDWEPPEDSSEWNKCLCPFHAESNPSAAVSFEHNGFRCLACGAGGDLIAIIRQEEKEVSFAEAKRIAEGVSVGGNLSVPRGAPKQSSRRVFGEPRGKGRAPVRAGLRERPTPWS